jgi:alkanesulfonate monooxygenase SsuD/methylene tetrahydromethanopterin reductase-like flavin-dependent oxidoreductase (luciferase family)
MPTHEFDFSRVVYSPDIEKMIKEKMQEVPVEAAEAVSIWGTPDDCIEKIESFIEAGATYFPLMLLQNLGYWGPPEGEMKDAMKLIGTRVLPYFREENR